MEENRKFKDGDEPKTLNELELQGKIWEKRTRGIKSEYHSLFKPNDVRVLAYFHKQGTNEPATYMEIARAYVSSSYSAYKDSCDYLVELGYMVKVDRKYKIVEHYWKDVSEGYETIRMPIPNLRENLKKLHGRRV